MDVYEPSIEELIKQRRRQLILHAFGYYRMNETIVTDHQYDKWAKELVELQRKYPDTSKTIEYHDSFKDYDGSTGYNLPLYEDWLLPTWNKLRRKKK